MFHNDAALGLTKAPQRIPKSPQDVPRSPTETSNDMRCLPKSIPDAPAVSARDRQKPSRDPHRPPGTPPDFPNF